MTDQGGLGCEAGGKHLHKGLLACSALMLSLHPGSTPHLWWEDLGQT